MLGFDTFGAIGSGCRRFALMPGATGVDRQGASVVREKQQQCDRGEIIVRGAVSPSTRFAADLRDRADRSRLPLA
jgi:hypothetical protein